MGQPFDLRGKRAIVTGGGTGIGRAVATGLAEANAELVLVGRRREPLQSAVEELMAKGAAARAIVCDVTDESQRRELAAALSGIDILVNNAGTSDRQPWLDVSQSDWDRVLAVNVTAAFQLAQLFAPGMIDRGFGRIINIASLWGTRAPDPARYGDMPSMDVPAYGASKAGLLGLTRHLASILAPDGITVNAISPGMFQTELTQKLITPRIRSLIEARTPMGRLGSGEDLGAAVVFLSSAGAGFVTGIDLVIDGGFSLW
jgi:NAD(P)-dependent dehydrogenase (short-subunit alcohol dehydrogenase family)